MKIKNLILLTALTATVNALALDVESTSGNLASLVTNPAGVTSLVVTGTVNAADLEFIADEMTSLTSLDMSGATVEAYSGKALVNGSGVSPANTLPAFSLAGLKATSVTLPSGLTAIGDGALTGSAITSLTIPASVESVGMGAFASCDGLTEVTVPAGVTTLGSNVFADCANLNSVVIDGAVKAIPASAFARCKALTSVTVPSSLERVDSAAFSGCTALSTFPFSGELLSIGASAFRSSGLTAANFSSTAKLREIGAWAFADATSLSSVMLPPTVATIGEGAFFNDAALSDVVIPAACTEIPNYAFTNASGMNWVCMHNSDITTIGDYALKGMDTIQEFYLPESLEYIGDYGLEGWTALNALHCVTTEVPDLGEAVFTGIDQPNAKLYVTQTMIPSFQAADQWNAFVMDVDTGVDNPVADDDTRIRGRFAGYQLVVEATSDIAEVRVYDPSGSQLTVVNPHAPTATVDTDQWNARIYLVRMLLTDGTTASLKLARR